MGGNIWKDQSIRLNKNEYFECCNQVQEFLDSTLGINKKDIFIIEAIKNKDTFGDMDIVIKNNYDLLDIQNKIQKCNLETFKNGNILSFLNINKFQIDLIFVNELFFNYACHYFSWNDLGNLLGRTIKQYGFKHGWNGLYYVQRSGDHVIKEHLLSVNYLDIINILCLDKYKFFNGFNTYEEMFDWLIASPLFISSIFKYENLNHTNRVRDRKRKSYNLFLDYLDSLDDSIKNKEFIKLTEEEKRSFVFSKFPKLKTEVEKIDEEIKFHNEVKTKFNGKLVMELTNLKSVELGNFIKYFKSYYTDEWIYNTSQHEINLVIKHIYKHL